MLKVRHVSRSFGGGTPERSNLAYWGGDIPWVTPKDMKSQTICASQEMITQKGLAASPTKLIDPGAVLLVFRSGILRHTVPVAMNTCSIVVNQDIRAFTFSDNVLPKFFLRYVQGLNDALLLFWCKQGATVESIEGELIRSSGIPVPPRDEQTKIVGYLDCETARIDALIEKKTRFIKLLKEKRQALITQAVTKGLDPAVPMKDSGVEWIGEVPAHWDVKSIGYVLDAIGDVDHFMPASVDKGVPYLMTGDLQEFASGVNLEACKQVSHSDYAKFSKRIKGSKGDVIMARYATIGTAMYVDIDDDFLVSYSCVTIKTTSSKVSGLYLFQYLKSDAFRQGIENQINTNTQGNVGINELKRVKMAIPDLSEQSRILEYLHSKLATIDNLAEKSQASVELLKERRSALITAAVTGQIDLREDAA